MPRLDIQGPARTGPAILEAGGLKPDTLALCDLGLAAEWNGEANLKREIFYTAPGNNDNNVAE